MNLDVELPADQLRQFPSANGFAWGQPRLQEGQDLAVDLVGAAWARLLWDQSRNPGGIEVRLGLIVGRSGHAILVGSLRHRRIVDGDATQHLVLDLHGVVRIEELASPKLWIAHILGGRIERTLFKESIRLRALAVVLCWHRGLPACEEASTLVYLCRAERNCQDSTDSRRQS